MKMPNKKRHTLNYDEVKYYIQHGVKLYKDNNNDRYNMYLTKYGMGWKISKTTFDKIYKEKIIKCIKRIKNGFASFTIYEMR